MQSMADMLHFVAPAIERATNVPGLTSVSGDRPRAPIVRSQSLSDVLPSITIPTPEAMVTVATLTEEAGLETANKNRTDWKLALVKGLWNRLWVQGRRRYVVLAVVALLTVGGLVLYLKHLEAQQCDCQRMQQQYDELKQNVLDQRRLLGIHQRWWEHSKRDQTLQRTVRSIVPSVQVMKDLLAKGCTRAEVLEYFHEGRLPDRTVVVQDPSRSTSTEPSQTEANIKKEGPPAGQDKAIANIEPPADTPPVLFDPSNNPTDAKIVNSLDQGPVYRAGLETAHMTLCIATVVLSMGMILVVVSKLSFSRRTRMRDQNIEERVPMVELASIVNVSREPMAPSDGPEAREQTPEGWHNINLGGQPSNRTSSASL